MLKVKSCAEALRRIRLWQVDHFPFRESVVAYDVAMLLYGRSEAEFCLFSDVVWHLNQPEKKVRSACRELLRHGWLRLGRDTKDARRRRLTLTPVALQTIGEYIIMVSGVWMRVSGTRSNVAQTALGE